MNYIIICAITFVGAGLTLFSGFGLGTILFPIFGLFFPVEIAITLTAIVHLLNNIFKFFLFRKNADRAIVLKFGLPAFIFSFLGAFLLNFLTDQNDLLEYNLANKVFKITLLKVLIGFLLILFALFDVIPKLKKIEFNRKYLSFGGALSGFFGGLSGHQGALRSAFLIRTGLTKESFIATGVVIAFFIDISRISIYLSRIINDPSNLDFKLITIATLSAFVGVYFGNKILKKTTLVFIQQVVAFLLFIYGISLIVGII
ncbi:Sulfite exporter TauE/SafE [Flavobacterium columnare]|uniref:Probable membrane transporter protein n=2 Tax=Flavobacterium TaxID=237 RepID=A0ABW8PQ68_9FLAO|nr:sulfite exporter TauE/SafE family protein [Flavobacterium columnare]SPE78049.1 Sulfite exporter TauE/SafE [Flavobacterium columnare]